MSLPRLSRNRPIVEEGRAPEIDFQREWQTVVEHLEQAEADIDDLPGTYQPLDSDLTAIAALTTTAYGRAFLALADAAALNSVIGVPGTFTPELRFGGASTGITYSTQSGSRTRMGNRLFFELSLILSNKGSATGAATIAGLPVNSVATFVAGMPRLSVVASVISPSFIIVSGASTILLQQLTTGSQANLTDANFTNTSSIVISGSYPV